MAKQLVRYVARHHLALLALFIALGGTSYAAMRLPANSVTTREVKNHSLLAKDLKRGQLTGARGRPGAPGPRGVTGKGGPVGDSGAKGATGPAGRLAAAEGWHSPQYLSPFCNPSEFGFWGDYGNGFAPGGYYRDALGVVRLKGVVIGSSINCPLGAIFTLPSGYRPAQDSVFAVPAHVASEGFARITVAAGGDVTVQGNADGRYSLDGIAFRAGG